VRRASGERAGHHDHRLDAQWRDLVPCGLGEHVECRLRCDVRAEERRDVDDRRAADIQQGPGASLTHVRQNRAIHSLRAEHVDVDEVRNVVCGERLDIADGQVTGVVHDDVELAGLGHDGGDRLPRGFLGLDVEGDGAEVEAFGRAPAQELLRVIALRVAHAGVDRVTGAGQ